MAGLRIVGILGGMGPEATILLQQKLIKAVPASDDKDHIPLLIDMNPQVPSRIAHLIDGSGADPGPTLARMAQQLQTAGATALAMPCNTAHHYATEITDAVEIPLLNIVELAADHAARQLGPGGCVGMLASPAVRHTRLFENALSKHRIRVIWPDDDGQMLSAIRAVKMYGPCTKARKNLLAASQELQDAGADIQFIACSEFSLIADSAAPAANAVDTLDLLVQAIIQASQQQAVEV